MVCTIYRPPDRIRQRPSFLVREMIFKPTFKLPKQLVWIGSAEKQVFTTEELAAHLLDVLMTEVESVTRRT
jgi:hypothetical protein